MLRAVSAVGFGFDFEHYRSPGGAKAKEGHDPI